MAPKICVLRVNLHGPACEKKVHKLLRKINGVYSIVINGEYGKVTVSGEVDVCTLITALEKVGRSAELLWEDDAPVNYANQFMSGGVEAIDPEELRKFSKMERAKQVEVTKRVKVKFKNHEDEQIQKSHTIKVDVDDVHGPKIYHGFGPRGTTTCSCHVGSSHGHATENNTNCHRPPQTGCGHETKESGNCHGPPPLRTGGGYETENKNSFCAPPPPRFSGGYATENKNGFCEPPPPRTGSRYATENNNFWGPPPPRAGSHYAKENDNSFCRPPPPRTGGSFATGNNSSFYGPPPPRTGYVHHDNFNWCGSSKPQRYNSGPAEPPHCSSFQYANCPPQPRKMSYSYPNLFSDDNPHGCTLM